jgi:hypothetical protein
MPHCCPCTTLFPIFNSAAVDCAVLTTRSRTHPFQSIRGGAKLSRKLDPRRSRPPARLAVSLETLIQRHETRAQRGIGLDGGEQIRFPNKGPSHSCRFVLGVPFSYICFLAVFWWLCVLQRLRATARFLPIRILNTRISAPNTAGQLPALSHL